MTKSCVAASIASVFLARAFLASADASGGNLSGDSYAGIMSVTKNSKDDIWALMSALALNSGACLGLVALFSALLRWFPKVFNNNVLSGAILAPPPGAFSWVRASWNVSTEAAAETAGLDSALLLEFCNLAMRISGVLTLPLVLLLCPLHFVWGGGQAGEDVLSRIDMGNVDKNHPWVYYVHAVTVWAVLATVWLFLYRAQKVFLKLRFKWLAGRPFFRANTILIERIPRPCRSEEFVRDFFSRIFAPEDVKEVYVLRRTSTLTALVAERDRCQQEFHKAELLLQRDGKRPLGRVKLCGPRVDLLDHYGPILEELEAQIREERARIMAASGAKETSPVADLADRNGAPIGGDGVFAHCAFVTFASTRQAEMARDLRYSANRGDWVASSPPEPSALRWDVLVREPAWSAASKAVGAAIVVGLLAAFMPICTLISSSARTVNAGPLQPLWASLAPTIGLQIMTAIFPALLLKIFRSFYALKSDPEAQHELQVWFFVFQLIFVILVTAVGNSLAQSVKEVSEQPLSIFTTLAREMPGATHFYLNYIVLQWTTHAVSLLRLGNLVKFLSLRVLHGEEEARVMAEPSDHDYGMGERHVRFVLCLVICITFSTLSPLVAPLAFINFAVCRLAYGHLIVFAESKSADLGGVFWVTQLKHVQVGALIYAALMIGLLSARSPGNLWPMAIVAPTFPLLLLGLRYFDQAFDWTQLPFDELLAIEAQGGTDHAGTAMKAARAMMMPSTAATADGACGRKQASREGAFMLPDLVEGAREGAAIDGACGRERNPRRAAYVQPELFEQARDEAVGASNRTCASPATTATTDAPSPAELEV